MNLQRIEQSINTITTEAAFIFHINDSEQHEQALELMEQLIEDYDKHEPLIELLSASIEKYEETAPELESFNEQLCELESGVAVLATLMDQHHLNTTDFQNEIGGKSLVSLILNGKRPLNLGHIKKLSKRFKLPPQVFI